MAVASFVVSAPAAVGAPVQPDTDCTDDEFVPEPDVEVAGATALTTVGDRTAFGVMTAKGPVVFTSKEPATAQQMSGGVAVTAPESGRSVWSVRAPREVALRRRAGGGVNVVDSRGVVLATAVALPEQPVSVTIEGDDVIVTVRDGGAGSVLPLTPDVLFGPAFFGDPVLMTCSPAPGPGVQYAPDPAGGVATVATDPVCVPPVDHDGLSGYCPVSDVRDILFKPPPWVCSLYVSNPFHSGSSIGVWSFHSCSGTFKHTSLRTCVQMKKKFLFFTSWDSLKCNATSRRGGHIELEPFTRCKRGKHTYRGIAQGSATPPTGTASVKSESNLTERC